MGAAMKSSNSMLARLSPGVVSAAGGAAIVVLALSFFYFYTAFIALAVLAGVLAAIFLFFRSTASDPDQVARKPIIRGSEIKPAIAPVNVAMRPVDIEHPVLVNIVTGPGTPSISPEPEVLAYSENAGSSAELSKRAADIADLHAQYVAEAARVNETQASHLSRTVSAVSQLARRLQDHAGDSQISANVAADALALTQKAVPVVAEWSECENILQSNFLAAAKAISDLTGLANEFDEKVVLINEFSNTAGLVALNASIKVSSSADSTTFELGHLAESARLLARQTSTLSTELNDAVRHAFEALEQVSRSFADYWTAGTRTSESLAEIERAANVLSSRFERDSGRANSDLKSATEIFRSLSSICDRAKETETEFYYLEGAARELKEVTAELEGKTISDDSGIVPGPPETEAAGIL